MSSRFFVFSLFILALASAVSITSAALFSASQKTLRVSFLAVGEGRAILVQSPTGAKVLIDGGPDRRVVRALSSLLGPLDRSLDLVIETNTRTAVAGGLPDILDRYQVRAFIAPALSNDSAAARLSAARVGRASQTLSLVARRGMHISLGRGAFLDVLAPDREALGAGLFGATVVRITYGKTSFLFPSDIPEGTRWWLRTLDASSTLASTVLSVGHFGAQDSLDSAWLRAVQPSLAVISVGKNPYGYPATTTRRLLRGAGVRVFTTQGGTVTLTSNGVSVSEE